MAQWDVGRTKVGRESGEWRDEFVKVTFQSGLQTIMLDYLRDQGWNASYLSSGAAPITFIRPLGFRSPVQLEPSQAARYALRLRAEATALAEALFLPAWDTILAWARHFYRGQTVELELLVFPCSLKRRQILSLRVWIFYDGHGLCTANSHNLCAMEPRLDSDPVTVRSNSYL